MRPAFWNALSLGRGLFLRPSALRGFDDQALFQGAGRDANIAHFAVDDGFDTLQVGHETAFGDGRDVRADAALFLGFTTAPDVTALNRARTSKFANSRHISFSKVGQHTRPTVQFKDKFTGNA